MEERATKVGSRAEHFYENIALLGYTPNHEQAIAEYMAEKYGAKVVSVDQVPDTAPPDAVY